MTRIYANENFPRRVVEELRKLGHDVLTTEEAGKSNQAIPDDEVLEFAIEQRRAVLTLNRWDFVKLHKENSDHTGVIVSSQDADAAGHARRIHDALKDSDDLSGQLIRVNRPS